MGKLRRREVWLLPWAHPWQQYGQGRRAGFQNLEGHARVPSTRTAPLSGLRRSSGSQLTKPWTGTPLFRCWNQWFQWGNFSILQILDAAPWTGWFHYVFLWGCCSNAANDFETFYCSVSHTSCHRYLPESLFPATESQSGQLPTLFGLGTERRETVQGRIWTQSRTLPWGSLSFLSPVGSTFSLGIARTGMSLRLLIPVLSVLCGYGAAHRTHLFKKQWWISFLGRPLITNQH